MKIVIPFESKQTFDTNIKEICSISLEHEISQNDKELLGNFIIEGDYKEYELAIKTKPFKFVIPFEVELPDNIKKDSLLFSIDNFTYDLINKDINIKINYILEYEEEILERKDEIINYLENNDEVIIEDKKEDTHLQEIKNNIITEEEKIISNADDDYMTYHVHFVKESETIEMICTKYNVTKSDIIYLNDNENINVNDKLLIPIINE